MEKLDKMDTESTKMSTHDGKRGDKLGGEAEKPADGGAPADGAEVDTWITREEASRVSGKSLRTIDRLRARGVLEDVPGAGVRVTKESLERYLRRKIAPRPTKAMTTVEAEHYDALLLQLQHKTKQIEDLSQRLLTWEGHQTAKDAEIEAERQKAAALAAELEAERIRAEEKDRAIQETKETADREQAKATALAAELEAERVKAEETAARERAKAEQLAAELEAERNKGFWARLFGRRGE